MKHFYSHILTINVDGKEETVILRDLQRHPSQPKVLHIDFLRVTADQKITVRVPIHFINEDTCVGVKLNGGIVSHLQTEVEIECLPKDLPEFIEVNIADLDLGQSLHLSDITLPEGAVIIALTHGEVSDQAIVSVIKPKVIQTEEEIAIDSEATATAEGEEEQKSDKEEKDASNEENQK